MLLGATSQLRYRRATALALIGLVALAALLRLPTLGAKSYWGDEISTLFLVQRGFGGMLAGIARLESTPPLYYALAKLWYAVAGSGEDGMRSLPALLGVATVPVAYGAARELVSRRAALITAALIALNPVLVWYSGEARSYSLAVFLCSAGLWAFARAISGGRRALLVWALASSLALATHYFSAFVILPEALLLLLEGGRLGTRSRVAAIGAVCCTAAALVPLAVHQSSAGHAVWIARTSLALRVVRAPVDLLVGFDAPQRAAVGGLASLLAAGGGWLAWRRVRGEAERRGVAIAAIIGAGGIALPVVIAIVGVDYFDSRNVLAAIVPLTIVLAAGFATLRGRPAVAAPVALGAVFVAVVATTSTEPKYHSEDWRAAMHALGPDGRTGRAVIVAPGQAGRKPAMVYLGEGTQPVRGSRIRVDEVDFVIAPKQGASRPAPSGVRRLESLHLPAFHPVARRVGSHWVAIRLRATAPHSVSVRELTLRLGELRPAVLLEQ